MECQSKVDPCRLCSLRVKANSVLCAQCGKLIHGRCAGVKRVTLMFSRNEKNAENVKGILERQLSRKISYVKKCKLYGNPHILATGCVQLEDVRLL